jgi:hypothetical protein
MLPFSNLLVSNTDNSQGGIIPIFQASDSNYGPTTSPDSGNYPYAMTVFNRSEVSDTSLYHVEFVQNNGGAFNYGVGMGFYPDPALLSQQPFIISPNTTGENGNGFLPPSDQYDKCGIAIKTDGSGWVGIAGVLNPTQALDVGGSIHASGTLILDEPLYSDSIVSSNVFAQFGRQYNFTVSSNWNSITYGLGLFVCISQGNKAAYSSDHGQTWDTVSLPFSHGQWKQVVFGSGTFVAISLVGKFAYSTDGKTWLPNTISGGESIYWFTVVYGGGYFVAGSLFGAPVIWSTDGINWTNSFNATSQLTASAYNNVSGYFVIISNLNGLSWHTNDATSDEWILDNSLPSYNWCSATYGNGYFVALSLSGDIAVSLQPNGTSWFAGTSLPGGISDRWVSITYGNGYFVAVGNHASAICWTTDPTDSWNSSPLPSSSNWTSVSYGGGAFVTVSDDSPNSAYSLDNGSTWSNNFVFNYVRSYGLSGNLIATNSLTTVNVFANTLILTGTTGVTSIDVTGNIYASNSLTTGNVFTTNFYASGTKSFKIPHPLKNNTVLIHSCIEGPRCDLLYRGHVKLSEGTANVNIDTESSTHPMTEGTFAALSTNARYFLQNNDSFDRVRGKMNENILTIFSENVESTDEITWMVISERKDRSIIDCDRTDPRGFLIPEHSN